VIFKNTFNIRSHYLGLAELNGKLYSPPSKHVCSGYQNGFTCSTGILNLLKLSRMIMVLA